MTGAGILPLLLNKSFERRREETVYGFLVSDTFYLMGFLNVQCGYPSHLRLTVEQSGCGPK